MKDDGSNKSLGLEDMPAEVMHTIAFSTSILSPQDVGMLGRVNRRLAEIFVHDAYGRDLHQAMGGAMMCIEKRFWRGVRFSFGRGWGGMEAVKALGQMLMVNCEEIGPDVASWEATVMWLIRGGGGCDWRDMEVFVKKRRMLPLEVASRGGHDAVVKTLIELGAPVDDRKNRALQAACTAGRVGAVRILLDAGTYVSRKHDNRPWFPIHYASWEGHADVVAELLSRGADVDSVTTTEGETPLHMVCAKGFTDAAVVLIEAGANINALTIRAQQTPLMIAAKQGRLDVARLLVEAGADLSLLDGNLRKDAEQWAQHYSQSSVATYLRQIKQPPPPHTLTHNDRRALAVVLRSSVEEHIIDAFVASPNPSASAVAQTYLVDQNIDDFVDSVHRLSLLHLL